ncbi:UDP-N-acetylmuramyl-tripeptide synthetase [Coriobacterium glomerans PW2]|uniref:UDP-N-acetylmuramyl-tripeptide synthetase n=1 Tax=Coriobacterium glomerans (strain ATCC 49209 / DSM 20642 / JCM 10262 / PW2) TaxID=700015 RepID=F2NAA3_CORGP|nr:UDP-N-acetylmuramyl-tripeptide synthetase [Coriobacterium glomerans]AEB06289.1 UDP-N-acetylmuramyl-tripeptide synthetase [Coriobacterium glomerans PW2]
MTRTADSARPGTPTVTLELLANELRVRGIACRVTGGPALVRGMSIDSRATEMDNLFVCKGAAFKPAYLTAAIRRGASAFLCQTQAAAPACDLSAPAELAAAAPDTPGLIVSDLRASMALIAPIIYGHPDRALRIVGVTGTKGKTTVTFMLRSILRAAGMEPSMVGSIEVDDGVERHESHNTTPEAPDLWRHLRNTVDSGRSVMIMEVSSQALKYDRVLGITLDVGCFLNIGSDHISPIEHPNFEDYLASKLRIFDQSETAVVNLDTDHLVEVLKRAQTAGKLVTISSRRTDADLRADQISVASEHIGFDIVERARRHEIALGMSGLFNVDNALAAAALARELGVDYTAIATGLSRARVPGRMERFRSPDGRIVSLVDYAHNELSFRLLFESIESEYPDRYVIAVFGAPGDKAFDRRHELPRIAGKSADLLIYTEDDPGGERVEDICAQLADNTPTGTAFEIVVNREQAVERAFEAARSHEGPALVLLLAKGDEHRQRRSDGYARIASDLELARRHLES